MWHPARMGFSLFTLTIKLDSQQHPPTISLRTNVDSMTYWSYHSRTSVHRYILLFFVIIFFLACLSFVANSLLNAMFTFTLQRLALVRTPYYQRLLKTAAARCSLHWLSDQNIILERGVDLSPRVCCHLRTHHQCVRNVAPIASTRESRDLRYRW